MTGLTAAFIIIGIIFIIGSFFVTEKMSAGDIDNIAKLNMEEIKIVMDREVNQAIEKSKEDLVVATEEVLLSSERSMEKESNEKIMAISDYSDTVLESMDKTHNEIMFLYSMLNDKHKELTDFANDLNELQQKLLRTREYIEKENPEKETALYNAEEIDKVIKNVPIMPDANEIEKEAAYNSIEENETVNHNSKILDLYKSGKDSIEIAKELGLGYGEVKLVLDLYKEKES